MDKGTFPSTLSEAGAQIPDQERLENSNGLYTSTQCISSQLKRVLTVPRHFLESIPRLPSSLACDALDPSAPNRLCDFSTAPSTWSLCDL
jgi:hypothetical protein